MLSGRRMGPGEPRGIGAQRGLGKKAKTCDRCEEVSVAREEEGFLNVCMRCAWLALGLFRMWK